MLSRAPTLTLWGVPKSNDLRVIVKYYEISSAEQFAEYFGNHPHINAGSPDSDFPGLHTANMGALRRSDPARYGGGYWDEFSHAGTNGFVAEAEILDTATVWVTESGEVVYFYGCCNRLKHIEKEVAQLPSIQQREAHTCPIGDFFQNVLSQCPSVSGCYAQFSPTGYCEQAQQCVHERCRQPEVARAIINRSTSIVINNTNTNTNTVTTTTPPAPVCKTRPQPQPTPCPTSIPQNSHVTVTSPTGPAGQTPFAAPGDATSTGTTTASKEQPAVKSTTAGTLQKTAAATTTATPASPQAEAIRQAFHTGTTGSTTSSPRAATTGTGGTPQRSAQAEQVARAFGTGRSNSTGTTAAPNRVAQSSQAQQIQRAFSGGSTGTPRSTRATTTASTYRPAAVSQHVSSYASPMRSYSPVGRSSGGGGRHR